MPLPHSPNSWMKEEEEAAAAEKKETRSISLD